MFLDYFEVLMLKIILKNIKKYIIFIYFQAKNTLKSNRYQTLKHPSKKYIIFMFLKVFYYLKTYQNNLF